MDITEEIARKNNSRMAALRRDRLPWWTSWREIADYYMPKRYIWLLSPQERARYINKNGNILDPTGTNAGRVLAAGMMNGITSPSRPWFKLRIANFSDDLDLTMRVWLDECERRMMKVFAESNFYNAMAVMYLDLVFFGSSAMLIYEDFDTVIRCYNCALGEYYLGQSDRLEVNIFAREFQRKVHQLESRWGVDHLSEGVKQKFLMGGAALEEDIDITHLITPNDGTYKISKRFKFVECYWETTSENKARVLSYNGFNEMPGIFPRWELTGNDSYGTGPGLDAMGDVIQLQHETKRKGQSLDFMVRPPMVADIQLQHRPTAILPGGTTFVAGINNVGMKPAYTVQPPLRELSEDIMDIQGRIRETFFNDLFKMISQLDTVRSATEIDARKEEKLIMLGPVLERFHNEALTPAIKRTFATMERAELLPEAPPNLQNAQLEIQFVSILSAAQSAVGVAPTERFLQLIGNISGVHQEALDIPNWEALLRDYARDIGVGSKGVNSRETVQQIQADRAQKQQAHDALGAAAVAAPAAKLLSETNVGGGGNALSQLVG